MIGGLELAVAAAAVRVGAGVVWWWLRLVGERARERERDRVLIESVRVAGPGVRVVDRRADGRVLAVWSFGRSGTTRAESADNVRSLGVSEGGEDRVG